MGKMKTTAAEELAASIVAASASWQGQKYARMAKGLAGVFKNASGITASLLKSTNPSTTQTWNIERAVTVLDSLEAITEIATAMVQWNADNKAPSGAKLLYLQNLAANPSSIGDDAGVGDLSYANVAREYNALIESNALEIHQPQGIGVNDSVQLTVTGSKEGTWKSKATSVATVSKTGELTGVSPGICTVEYTGVTGKKTSIIVNVGAWQAASISGTNTVKSNYTTNFIASVPNTHSLPNGYWSSDKPSVARVSQVSDGSGDIIGISAGTCTIYWTSPISGYQGSKSITVS